MTILQEERDELAAKVSRLVQQQHGIRKRMMRERMAAMLGNLTLLTREVTTELVPPPGPLSALSTTGATEYAIRSRRLEKSPHSTMSMPQLTPATPPSIPRIIDLVLFSEADVELVPLRIQELGDRVDVIVLAETAFRFSDAQPKASAFDANWILLGKSVGVEVRHYQITASGLDVCSPIALRPRGTTAVPKGTERMRKRPGLLEAKCRESFGRNGLVQAFNDLGGTDSDIALISDADEVPRAEAMQMVRQLTVGRMAVSLGAVHHFKYTMRCERGWRHRAPGATWLKGPIAATGSYLRAAGAQSIRTPDGCVEVGAVPHCYTNHTRIAIANASWHMSSVSGGIDGVIRKMRDNAANHLYDRNQTLFKDATVRERAQLCQHGENANANSRGALSYERTIWGRRAAPRYPDVPRSLEQAFRRRELLHFLSWEKDGAQSPEMTDSTPAGIHVTSARPIHYRQTGGPCNRLGCDRRHG